MKKFCILLATGIFFSALSNAQTIKKAPGDTVKAGRANDRLRNAGPQDGWPLEGHADTSKKIKKQAGTTRRIKQRSNQ